MHRAEFSEFTYSFAVTMDLMQKFYGDARRPTGQIWLPFFPNLRDERFLGFDVYWICLLEPFQLHFSTNFRLK
jgi:hypothetical protein